MLDGRKESEEEDANSTIKRDYMSPIRFCANAVEKKPWQTKRRDAPRDIFSTTISDDTGRGEEKGRGSDGCIRVSVEG